MKGGRRNNSGRKAVIEKRKYSLTFHMTEKEKKKCDAIFMKIKREQNLKSKIETLFYILDQI